MITTLNVRVALLRAIAATILGRALPGLAVGAFRGAELAGMGCATVFLHTVWPPLVWLAAAAILLLIGQRR